MKQVDYADRLVEAVRSMSSDFANQDEAVENEKVQELEKEPQAGLREMAQDTCSKVE